MNNFFGSGGGDTPPQFRDAALYLSFMGGAVPDIGSGVTVALSRAATAFVENDEGMYELANAEELRFAGFRRVENFITKSEDFSHASWTKGATAAITGTNTINLPAVADSVSIALTSSKLISVGSIVWFFVELSGSGTVTLKLETAGGVAESASKTITLSSTPKEYAVPITLVNASHTSLTASILRDTGNTATTVTANKAQVSQVTGRINATPPNYVSKGVKSSPYHGCLIDGVKYFTTEPGSTYNSTSGIVTRGMGKKLPYSKLKGRLDEGAVTNYVANSSDGAFTAFTKGDVTATANSAVAPDGTNTASLLTANATTANHRLLSPLYTVPAGSFVTTIFHLSAGTAPYIILAAKQDGSNYAYACIDTSSWQITERGFVGTARDVAVIVEPLGYLGRVKISVTGYFSASNTGAQSSLAFSNTSTPGAAQVSYLGTGESVYVWNPEVCVVETPNRPKITTGAAAANTADVITYGNVTGVDIDNCTIAFTAHARGLLNTAAGGNYAWLRLGPDDNNNVGFYAGTYTDAYYAPGAVAVKSWVGGVGTTGTAKLIDANTAFTNYAASFGGGKQRGACNGASLFSVAPYVYEDSVAALPTGTATLKIANKVSHCIKDLAIFAGTKTTKELMELTAPRTEMVLVLDGDSLTAPVESSTGGYNTERSYPREIWKSMGHNDAISISNQAVSSSRMYEGLHPNLSVEERRDTYTLPMMQAIPAQSGKSYMLHIGTNDYGAGHAYTDVITYEAAHHLALKAGVPGLRNFSVSNIASNSVERTAYCNNLRTGKLAALAANTLNVEGVADCGGDSALNDFADTATAIFRPDRVHVLDPGHTIMAQKYVAPELVKVS